ncbi:hypothetical protein LSH36_116g00030 [Paralvinella palmiformis]|uniref:Uncharacterized protein n=1 Tax=Paralvinella palmiformis TaxID=53620 RepID=A0AAD9JZQ9_9ANNE|nr:hypothetical protein LSH36_116g00030 [Paralvinella palmiformis]
MILHIVDHVVFAREEEVKYMWPMPMSESSRGICSRRLTTYVTYDCSTLRATIRLKDDYNIITQYNIGTKRFEPTCNTTLFHEELRLDDDPPYIPRELLAHCEKVLYNRIPKSASTTFRNIFDILAPQNNLTAIFLHKQWKMSERIRNNFAGHIRTTFKKGFLLTSHYYFDSFKDVLGDTGTYIQVIREPSDWILSYLNWKKYGSVLNPGGKKDFTDMNIETCIYDKDCLNTKFNFAGALAFICGQDDMCRSGTEESLRLAVHNIERYYLVVGLFEDLPAYVEVLEYLMPHVFFNITNVFADEVKPIAKFIPEHLHTNIAYSLIFGFAY